VNFIFTPVFPLTLPLSPDSGGEGGVRGYFRGAFYATFRFTMPWNMPDVFAMSYRAPANPAMGEKISPCPLTLPSPRGGEVNSLKLIIIFLPLDGGGTGWG